MLIAAYQGVCADGDPEANLAVARDVFDRARGTGADFLLMPEAFLSGYGSKALIEAGAMAVDDARLGRLIDHTSGSDLVFMVGLCERADATIYNTELIIQAGRVLGAYRKTMLTGSDYRAMGFGTDFDLPVWQAKGVTFGVIVCADSSYMEVAQTMWWKGAQIIFSPHYNYIPSDGMDDHRIHVRNNHVGIAALLQVPVVRANVVNWDRAPRLGYGDSAIFDARGHAVTEAGLFKQGLITAELDLAARPSIGGRMRIPMEVRQQLSRAMLSAEIAQF